MMPWHDALPNLVLPHRQAAGGHEWTLSAAGIWLNGNPPEGTRGAPLTVRRIWRWFGHDIVVAATRFGVPVELIVATIATESAGGEEDREKVCTAERREFGFKSVEHTPGQISVGCMQTTLLTAWIAMHDDTLTIEDLRKPAVSIAAGTAYIAQQFPSTRFDPPKVAAAYNAGGVYPEPIGHNPWAMRCFPLLSGAHITRFVAWFNDAMRLATVLEQAAAAPSFVRALYAVQPQSTLET